MLTKYWSTYVFCAVDQVRIGGMFAFLNIYVDDCT